MPPQTIREQLEKELGINNNTFEHCHPCECHTDADGVLNIIIFRFKKYIEEEVIGDNTVTQTYRRSERQAEDFFDDYLVDNEEEGRSIPYRYITNAFDDSQNALRASQRAKLSELK